MPPKVRELVIDKQGQCNFFVARALKGKRKVTLTLFTCLPLSSVRMYTCHHSEEVSPNKALQVTSPKPLHGFGAAPELER